MKHTIDVTILNGQKHMKNSRRGSGQRPRRNPDNSGLLTELGKTFVTTIVGALVILGGAWLTSKVTVYAPVATDTAAQATDRAQTAMLAKNMILAAGGLAVGAGLHYNGMAPRVGKAIMGGSVAVAAVSTAASMRAGERLDAALGLGAPAPAAGAAAPAAAPPAALPAGGAGAAAPTSAGLNSWQAFQQVG